MEEIQATGIAMERMYTIPLRGGWLKKPRSKRAPRAIRDIRTFIARHTKAEQIIISKALNQAVWASGIQRPPAKVKVKVVVEGGRASVTLPDEIVEKAEKGRFEKVAEGKGEKDETIQTGAAVQTEPAKKTG